MEKVPMKKDSLVQILNLRKTALHLVVLSWERNFIKLQSIFKNMANNEGGQFLITDSNAKGAAVLSALEVSHNDTDKH